MQTQFSNLSYQSKNTQRILKLLWNKEAWYHDQTIRSPHFLTFFFFFTFLLVDPYFCNIRHRTSCWPILEKITFKTGACNTVWHVPRREFSCKEACSTVNSDATWAEPVALDSRSCSWGMCFLASWISFSSLWAGVRL